MRSAIYIIIGCLQFVLTPENEFEKNILKSFYSQPEDFETLIVPGEFHESHAGYIRNYRDGNSLIIKIKQSDAK
jgi:hypothetical protein